MRRAMLALAAVLLLAGCGGGGGGGGGGGDGGEGEVPPISVVWFGTGQDPVNMGVTGRSTRIPSGTPMFAVGHLVGSRATADVTADVSSPGGTPTKLPVTAPGDAAESEVFGADLSAANLGPGSYTVSFVSKGRILASATVTVT